MPVKSCDGFIWTVTYYQDKDGIAYMPNLTGQISQPY